MRTKQITQAMLDCYIVINHGAMLEMGRLGEIRYLGANKEKGNEYFGINRSNNCLAGIVQDSGYGVYCITDKFITRFNGKYINLVEELKRYNFVTHFTKGKDSSGRERTRTANKIVEELGYTGTINIEQIIQTLVTGKISGRKTGLEVHHEVAVYDHRIDVCKQLTKAAHAKSDSKSKMNGIVIENVNELAWLIQALEVSRINKVPITKLL